MNTISITVMIFDRRCDLLLCNSVQNFAHDTAEGKILNVHTDCGRLLLNPFQVTLCIAEHFGVFNSTKSCYTKRYFDRFDADISSVDFATVLIFMRLIINRVH